MNAKLYEAASRLNVTALHAGLAALRAARQSMDAVIVALCTEAGESDYVQPLAYANHPGQTFRRSFGALMQHFFNHQTHHRGQATTLLRQAGVDVGVTDLLALIPESAAP